MLCLRTITQTAHPCRLRGDKIATQQIESALEAIDVRMLDHIIVAGQQYYSMAEGGLL